MTDPNSQTEKPKENRRFNEKQYEMLKRCSENKDMTEWIEWRERHPNEDILLEGANLDFCNFDPYLLKQGLLCDL